ncbi:phage head closure protein [Limosilactobacillus portuensis]|uniref:phage head closure protein n=1 Tax=Limosilactobacillus portuensis TaxID=2742601 RepID=UPI003D756188
MARSGKLYRQTYQFRHVGEFGVSKSVSDPNTGANIPKFQAVKRLHFARKKQTLSEKAQVAGTEYADSIVITIRHNKALAEMKSLFAKINGDVYEVINYSVDDDSYDSVDLLTLKHTEKIAG